MNGMPNMEDHQAWGDLLRELAEVSGAHAVAITFDFGGHDVTYTGAGPEEDGGE